MADMNITDTNSCQGFLENLDPWMEGDLDQQQEELMQAHIDTCPACAMETRLARNIDAITQSLPIMEYPEQLAVTAGTSTPKSATGVSGLFAKLLRTWQQPLVFGPALAMILAAGIFIHIQQSNRTVEPEVIVVNGEEYTPEEVIQAAQELELALQYLNKYSNYAARVVRHELHESDLPLSSPEDDSNDPSI